MVSVCQTCGDRGYSEALVYCHKCQIHAVHRYCMEFQKVTFEEDVIWFCEVCKPMNAEDSDIVQATLPELRLKEIAVSMSKMKEFVSAAALAVSSEKAMMGMQQNAKETNLFEKETMHVIHCLQNQIFAEEMMHAGQDYQAVAVDCAPSSPSATAPFLQEPTDILQPQDTMFGGSQGEKRTDSFHQSVNQSTRTHMNGMAAAGDEHVNPDETDFAYNSVCYVGPYLVNVDVAPVVRSIIDKHPDFSQDCPLSVGTISRLLQRLGMELKKVMSITSENLRIEHLKSLDSTIREAEFGKLNVNSLRHWHDQLKRAMLLLDLLELRNKIKTDLAKRNELPVSTKTSLNMDRDTLTNMRRDIQLLKTKAASLEIEIQDQGGSTGDFALKCLSKIKRFCDRTLAGGLL